MLEIDHIRKRPGMYVGRLGDGTCESDGIYTMLKRVLNSLVAQFRTGATGGIAINIEDNRSVTVCYHDADIEYIEIIEALSSSYDIKKDDGITLLSFTPDESIFGGFSYRRNIVTDILKSYCYANKGLIIRYNGKDICALNGLADLINDELRDDLKYPVIHLSGPGIEIAFSNRARTPDTTYHSFVNGIKTGGGTHVNALKDALAPVMEGLSAAISIDIVDPVFGQANPHSLASPKVSPAGPDIHDFVYDFLSTELPLYFKQNPESQRFFP